MKFDNNGIGKLADAQSCTVTEKRNGSYELKLICPADGIHAEMLEEGNVILAKPSDTMQPQPFRIYKITTPIDGKLEVQARHISYQLNFITVSPFSVTGCVGAMQGLKSHAASDCPFSVWTDVASSAMFTVSVPASFRNCLGGMDGSVLDTFGGEFEWDRYTVKFHRARGADHNVHIVYGKNLTDFKMEKSIENTITGVHPYWVDNETQAVMELPEKVVMVSRKSVPYQKITVLDCTSAFQERPSEAALREYAQDYIDTTSLTEPEVDIKIDFIQLWNTPGYEDVVQAEQVSLCDTVHVYISKLGIEASSKVTETEYDSLLERYNSITLSNSTVSSRNSSLTSSLNSIRNTATAAYDTAVRVETAVGEQMGGISASIIYDGALFAALFGLHYKNETDSKDVNYRYLQALAILEVLGVGSVPNRILPSLVKSERVRFNFKEFLKKFDEILVVADHRIKVRCLRLIKKAIVTSVEESEIKEIISEIVRQTQGQFNEGDINEWSEIFQKVLSVKRILKEKLISLEAIRELLNEVERYGEKYSFY